MSYNAGLINCRSVVKMTVGLKVELVDCNLHVCALTETWLKEGDNTTPNQDDRTGGGIGLIHKLGIT